MTIKRPIIEFGSFAQKSQHGVPFSCDKVDSPKFFFNYVKLGTSDYVKNVFVQGMLEYNDDKYKVIVLADDPNNNPKSLARNLCNTQKLTNEMNFSKKFEANSMWQTLEN
jgi:hypothetical protein